MIKQKKGLNCQLILFDKRNTLAKWLHPLFNYKVKSYQKMNQNQVNPPNLFTYATKELSQDAFICWLAAWADTAYKKEYPLLQETSRRFIASLFDGTDTLIPNYDSIKIHRQVGNVGTQIKIDVVIELLHKKEAINCIIIEDKINSKVDNPLNEYRKIILEHKNFNYTEAQIICRIIKTGFDGRKASKSGFLYYGKEELFTVLQKGIDAGIENNIFKDFYDKQKQEIDSVNKFKTTPFVDWGDDERKGLAIYLYQSKKLKHKNWESELFNANKVDSFWFEKVYVLDALLHIALYPKKREIQFRLWTNSKAESVSKRTAVFEILKEKFSNNGIKLKHSYTSGESLRLAFYPTPDDIFKVHDNGLLDLAHLENKLVFLGELIQECGS